MEPPSLLPRTRQRSGTAKPYPDDLIPLTVPLPPGTMTLDEIAGVREGDRHARTPEGDHARDRARLRFKPLHAMTAILLLLVALCASLTMLIQQSSNYSALERTSATSPASNGGDGAAGRTSGANDPSAGASGSASATETHERQNTAPQQPTQPPPTQSQSPPATQQSAIPPPAQSQALSGKPPNASTPVDLNTADANALDTLTGIGPVTAQRIVEYRARLGGRFSNIDQLLDIKGIGVKTLEKIRSQVTLG